MSSVPVARECSDIERRGLGRGLHKVGIFQIDDFAEAISARSSQNIGADCQHLRIHPREQRNGDQPGPHGFPFELPTPSLEQKTLRLFLRIAKEFPRPGTSFSINYWGAEMVLGKILDNKEETFDEKFIAMFQDILPWLSYGWIVNGQELAYVVQRTLQDNYGFLEKGLASGDLCITPAGRVFPTSR